MIGHGCNCECGCGTRTVSVVLSCGGVSIPQAGMPVELVRSGAVVSSGTTGADGLVTLPFYQSGTHTVRVGWGTCYQKSASVSLFCGSSGTTAIAYAPADIVASLPSPLTLSGPYEVVPLVRVGPNLFEGYGSFDFPCEDGSTATTPVRYTLQAGNWFVDNSTRVVLGASAVVECPPPAPPLNNQARSGPACPAISLCEAVDIDFTMLFGGSTEGFYPHGTIVTVTA